MKRNHLRPFCVPMQHSDCKYKPHSAPNDMEEKAVPLWRTALISLISRLFSIREELPVLIDIGTIQGIEIVRYTIEGLVTRFQKTSVVTSRQQFDPS